MDETSTYKGYIKHFYLEKGYGYIYCFKTKQTLFFHLNEIQSEGFIIPKKGAFVTFEKLETEKGSRAVNVLLKKEKP